MKNKTTKTILIIEDDDMLASLLSNQLTSQEFNVILAHDGDEGLQKIFSERPDAVILDIVMPKKDGITLLEELHEQEPENKTPIIVLTNSADMDTIASAIKHKTVAYLMKSDQHIQSIVDLVKEKINLA